MNNEIQRMMQQSRETAAAHVPNNMKPDFPRSTWIANIIGLIGAFITAFVYFGIQRLFRQLPPEVMIDSMQGSSNSLCFAGMTSAATILPLMLTIFSFARNADQNFDPWFYKRIKVIALLCCAAFIIGLLTLTLLSAPISDIDSIETTWYWGLYVGIVLSLSSMVGVLIAILILLFYAILHIINQLQPDFQQRQASRSEVGNDS